MKALSQRWAFVVLSLFLALQLASLAKYWADQRYLLHLADGIAPASLPASEQAKHIVAFLREKPSLTGESYFLFPVLEFLRPTARQVADRGGDCADRSRFMIVMLRLRGIHASKWALYSPAMKPKHAVVELDAEHGKMVVDPLFGLWFPREQPGSYYGIRELRQNPQILRTRVLDLLARRERPGTNRLETYPLEEYIYDHGRTINWDKSWALQLLYRFLRNWMKVDVDEIPRPPLVEQPALMTVAGVVPLELVVVLFWLRTTKTRR